jgi:predicted CXXCH cytochrome family protein
MPLWFRLLWIACLALAVPASAQTMVERLITPGPLSQPHARLESKCDSCHTSFQKTEQNSRCAACHKGVGSDIATGTRFHGKFAPARSGQCKSCHSEHKGRAHALIKLDRASFNHSLTDYPLTGGHAKATCAGCHGADSNYRGVSRDCVNCHLKKEPHKGQLGRSCQNCHTVAGWKPVRGYNHAKTGFALVGAHNQASCMSCHAGQRWKGLGRTCVACHAKDDAHRGTRGTNCAECHSSTAWGSARFDHAATGFPLIGAHAATACAGCHLAGNARPNPPRTCVSCHAADDQHKGNNGTDCASCHNPRSWKQTSFDHDKLTKFPLKGAHRTATCEGCHKQPAKLVKPSVDCVACHAADDKHKGGNGSDCKRCHVETAWKSVNFNHATMTRFALSGKHALAQCTACHVKPADTVKLSMECNACHAKDDAHSGRLGPRCGDCHDANDWKKQVLFDHGLTRFPLLGKHVVVTCAGCHADKTFKAKGVACAACHVDERHKGTLGVPAACATCHNNNDWKSWAFDHDKTTKFPLTGEHRGLICSACHVRPGDPAKQPNQCVDCHRRDDVHREEFGSDCARCHVTTSFKEIVLGRTHRAT